MSRTASRELTGTEGYNRKAGILASFHLDERSLTLVQNVLKIVDALDVSASDAFLLPDGVLNILLKRFQAGWMPHE